MLWAAKSPAPALSFFDLEKSIAREESAVPGLLAGAERKFFFTHAKKKDQTPVSVLYLHGFSASRMELSPLPELLAHELEANLYFGRLRGHGISGSEGLRGVTLEQWEEDVEKDLAIARQIGKRVIVLANSTAAPLLLHALNKNPAKIDAAIFLSPNFALAQWNAPMLLWPIAPTLLHWIVGEYREWSPVNSQQKYYWTLKYPALALIQVARAAHLSQEIDLEKMQVPMQFIYSAEDDIVDLKAIRRVYERVGSRKKSIYELRMPGVGHIIAGNIVAPQSTELLKNKIAEFLSAPVQ